MYPPGRWEDESSGPIPAWGDSRGWVSWNAAASSDRLHWGDASESDNGRGSHDDRSIGSYQAQLDPDVELQWSQITGMKLLENIDLNNCPWNYPDDMDNHPWLVESFMMSMHMALKDIPDDSLMDLEKKHVTNRAHLARRPVWMTLAPPEDLKCWAPILLEQKIDEQAISSLLQVISSAHSGSHGYYESIRIIAHLLKDSEHESHWRNGPSAWLHKACNESLKAMLNWDEWDCEHNGKMAGRSSRASTSMPTCPRSHWDDYKPITRPGRGLR